MYQSVFVIGEARRECVIATEVSQQKETPTSSSASPQILHTKRAVHHQRSNIYDSGY